MRRVGGSETQRSVLVDVNNLLYRAYFAFVKARKEEGRENADVPPEYQSPEERPPTIARLPGAGEHTGQLLDMEVDIIHGSLKILSSWLYDIQSPTRVVAFFDGLPKRRLALFPDYKKRDTSDEDRKSVHIEGQGGQSYSLRDGTVVHGPIAALAHVFRLIGCDVYHHPGEEADDLIASFVRKSDGVNIILSSDKDFFQLVGDRTVVYRPGPKTPRLHDAERVEDAMQALYKVRVGPSGIRMFKTLTGDSSDGIFGVHGLRKKVAAPLCHLSTVEEVYASGLPGFSKGEREKAIAAREQIELNHRLVGFYDDIDLEPCLRPAIGDFPLATQMLREDLNVSEFDLMPFRIGKHTPKRPQAVPDWLADI